MQLDLSDIANILGTSLQGRQVEATGYSIDSRTIARGDLFFAIRGPQFDGHDFIAAAWESGAAAVVAERSWAAAHQVRGPLLAVSEPAEALRRLAREARRRWGQLVVGVTGSNGKTTTKDAIAALLAQRFQVAKTEGNLNNDLGLPLSILRMHDAAEVGVFEMGMNHRGEITALAEIAAPTVGVVTNVSEAHVEYFSSADEIALAKRELIEALPADGTAVLNADDLRVRAFRDAHAGQVCDIRREQGSRLSGDCNRNTRSRRLTVQPPPKARWGGGSFSEWLDRSAQCSEPGSGARGGIGVRSRFSGPRRCRGAPAPGETAR